MGDIRDLYQEAILDHYKHPRNSTVMDDASATAQGHNPLCGDKVVVYVKVGDGTVDAVSFQSTACAICTSSASLMTQAVQGLPIAEAESLSHDFVRMARGEAPPPEHPQAGKLVIYGGISEFASRVKCATLPWHALESALEQVKAK